MEEPQPKRAVTVEVPGDGAKVDVRLGADLDEVLREIVRGLIRERGWPNQTKAAEAMGLTQQALNNFLNRKNGCTLSSLSRMCAALQLDPTQLFGRHPDYANKRHFAADFVFDQFRAVLDKNEAARLINVLNALKARGALGPQIDALESTLATPVSRRTSRRKNAN